MASSEVSLALPVVRTRLNTAAIKERLLHFCQRATAEYKVRKVTCISAKQNKQKKIY